MSNSQVAPVEQGALLPETSDQESLEDSGPIEDYLHPDFEVFF